MYILILTFILVNIAPTANNGNASVATTQVLFHSEEEACDAARVSWSRSSETVNQMDALKRTKYVVLGTCHKQ